MDDDHGKLLEAWRAGLFVRIDGAHGGKCPTIFLFAASAANLSIRQIGDRFTTRRGRLRRTRACRPRCVERRRRLSCACRRRRPSARRDDAATIGRDDHACRERQITANLRFKSELDRLEFFGRQSRENYCERGDPQSRLSPHDPRRLRGARRMGVSGGRRRRRTRGWRRHFAFLARSALAAISPGVDATYTTAQGLDIINDTSPSGVTTNPSPLSAGLTSAKLTVSGDATSVATSASLNTGGLHVAATSNPGAYTFSQSCGAPR